MYILTLFHPDSFDIFSANEYVFSTKAKAEKYLESLSGELYYRNYEFNLKEKLVDPPIGCDISKTEQKLHYSDGFVLKPCLKKKIKQEEIANKIRAIETERVKLDSELNSLKST